MEAPQKIPRTILTCFAGRRVFMEVQLKYVVEMLDRYEWLERYDIWNFAWNDDDKRWIDSLSELNSKIRICYAPYDEMAERAGEVASRQFAYFFSEAYPIADYNDAIFVKIDDDTSYIDVKNFDNFIAIRAAYPNYFLVSADVANHDLKVKNPTVAQHDLIEKLEGQQQSRELSAEVFSNKLRLSINFVSWLGADLPLIQDEFSNGIGSDDEWRMCHVIASREKRNNLVIRGYDVAHLCFFAQLSCRNYDVNGILERYDVIADSQRFPPNKAEIFNASDLGFHSMPFQKTLKSFFMPIRTNVSSFLKAIKGRGRTT